MKGRMKLGPRLVYRTFQKCSLNHGAMGRAPNRRSHSLMATCTPKSWTLSPIRYAFSIVRTYRKSHVSSTLNGILTLPLVSIIGCALIAGTSWSALQKRIIPRPTFVLIILQKKTNRWKSHVLLTYSHLRLASYPPVKYRI